jgi:hypothetical protein
METMNAAQTTERALIRTIAGSSRKLDEDIHMSPLQAIDRLQKLHEKFREQWIGPSPWLVLEDCYVLPPNMPVAKMLEEMATHGQPIGMVGMAFLKFSKRYAVLQMLFRSRNDVKSRKTIERSVKAAESLLVNQIQQIDVLKSGKADSQ